jgi:hypothetical protein
MRQCNRKKMRFRPPGSPAARRPAARKPAWMLALRGGGELFSIIFKNLQKNPQVPPTAAVTSYKKRVKACKTRSGLQECSRK